MSSLDQFGLKRKTDGSLAFTPERDAAFLRQGFAEIYPRELIRYLNCLDSGFRKALETSEFELVSLLIRMRGVEDAGWDPYESTRLTIRLMRGHWEKLDTFETQRTLELWIYGHIVEASEPYEMMMNLAEISNGGRFNGFRFPPSNSGRPQSPGEKIRKIEAVATAAGLPSLVAPLKDIWNRELRNAIFHADYSIFSDEVRTRRPDSVYTNARIMTYINQALAFHDAMSALDLIYRGLFVAPKCIPVHPEFEKWPGEKAWVIVRKGYGAIGLHHALSQEELRDGKIPWHFGRFYRTEIDAMRDDDGLLLHPKGDEKSQAEGCFFSGVP